MSRCSVKTMILRGLPGLVDRERLVLRGSCAARSTCGPCRRTAPVGRARRGRRGSRSRSRARRRSAPRWRRRRRPPRVPPARLRRGPRCRRWLVVEVAPPEQAVEPLPQRLVVGSESRCCSISRRRFSSRSRRRSRDCADRLGAGGEAALEDGEREADGVAAPPSPSALSRSARFISSRTYSVTASYRARSPQSESSYGTV